MEGMNQFRTIYIHTWKCHNETPCVAILNKQKCLFFKNEGQEGKMGPVLGLLAVGEGKICGRGEGG
jgi:hypothetical protein